MDLTARAQAFIDAGATLLDTHDGVKFYEHPTRGDTAPIFAIGAYGQLVNTGFHDLGNPDEVIEAVRENDHAYAMADPMMHGDNH